MVNTSVARAAYQAEMGATEQLIGLQRQQLRTIQVQVDAGTAAYSDVLSLHSLIAANEATLAPLKQQISRSEDLLATLEGIEPSRAILPDIDLNALLIARRAAADPAVGTGPATPRHPGRRNAAACGQRRHRRRDRRPVPPASP